MQMHKMQINTDEIKKILHEMDDRKTELDNILSELEEIKFCGDFAGYEKRSVFEKHTDALNEEIRRYRDMIMALEHIVQIYERGDRKASDEIEEIRRTYGERIPEKTEIRYDRTLFGS